MHTYMHVHILAGRIAKLAVRQKGPKNARIHTHHPNSIDMHTRYKWKHTRIHAYTPPENSNIRGMPFIELRAFAAAHDLQLAAIDVTKVHINAPELRMAASASLSGENANRCAGSRRKSLAALPLDLCAQF